MAVKHAEEICPWSSVANYSSIHAESCGTPNRGSFGKPTRKNGLDLLAKNKMMSNKFLYFK